MQHRKLGSSDIEVSAIAFGAWAIGGWRWGGTDDEAAIRAIHAAIDAGITLIDTAPAYGWGHSETIVGRAIQDRRDDVVIATKCGLRTDTDQGVKLFSCNEAGEICEEGPVHIHKYLAPHSVREEVEASLKRLDVDYIDLMQTHWQEDTTPIADTMAELIKLKDAGKIRAIGVSNATLEHLDEYRAAGPVVSDQERYSMLDRGLEETNLPHCREHNIAIIAYSPLSHGLLSGKVTVEREFNHGDLRTGHPRFTREALEKNDMLLADLKPLADAHDATIAQLVIAWTIAQPGITCALVGARSPEQAQENAAAGDLELTDSDFTQIAAALDRHAERIK